VEQNNRQGSFPLEYNFEKELIVENLLFIFLDFGRSCAAQSADMIQMLDSYSFSISSFTLRGAK
jgi:hypothetical protein